MSGKYSDLFETIDGQQKIVAEKRSALLDVDMFVLDNSLRESTVGQLRGHTLENKWTILNEVKKCGFKHIIVAAFSHAPRVDDAFVRELSAKEKDLSTYYAFSEIGEGKDKEELPVGLKKMKEHKLRNPIFEIDVASESITTKRWCDLLQKRIDYTYDQIDPNAKIFVNFRDLPFAMENPIRVFEIVEFLATMPEEKRIFGILFEEPTGRYLPEQVGGWTKAIRQLMNTCKWDMGHLLAHIHKKWDFSEVTQIECLSTGANGIWASVCEEGASLGHACSVISIMNLLRLGNRKVLKKFNCTYLREAAINVTRATTGRSPHPKQVVYGERALDMSFDFGGIAGGHIGPNDFNMAEFFGVKPPKRISTLASADMIRKRLVELFGESDDFSDEVAQKMKTVMIEDLSNNCKEEYMSHVGLAILFDRAGGSLTVQMRDVIADVELNSHLHKRLLREVREIWDEWNYKENDSDECLEFHSFYNGFMAPYFGCYECEDSKKGLQAIDMDNDNKVDWSEFCVYLKWALHEYPSTATVEELLTTAFQKGLIPAMRDEMVKTTKK